MNIILVKLKNGQHEFYLCGNAKALARNQMIKKSIFPVWWTFVQHLQSRATLIGGDGINRGRWGRFPKKFAKNWTQKTLSIVLSKA